MNRRKFIHSAIAVVGLGPSVPQLISKLRLPKEEVPSDFYGEWKFVTGGENLFISDFESPLKGGLAVRRYRPKKLT